MPDFLLTCLFRQLHRRPELNWTRVALSEISRNSKYGFLAVSEVDGLGYCGGLLVLTVGGRPVEFHCTAPVAANRAQEILYGATLKEFLVSDQIGNSLLNKAKAKLDIVIVDQMDLCGLQESSSLPFVLTASEGRELSYSDAADAREHDGNQYQLFAQDIDRADGLVQLFIETLPLSEPFDRIYQAIGEARADAA